MPTLSIRDQVRNIVDPMFLSLREALYGSGVTYNNYIARSTIPPATDTGTGGVKLSNATPLDVTTLLVSAGVSNDVARADHRHKLDATGVASGTYGDATHIPRIAVDQSGRITFASGITFSGGGSVTYVGLIPPASGITVVGSPITSSGSFIISLANDLAALENLTGSGVAVRTAVDTWELQRPLNLGYGGTGTSTIFTLGSVIFAGASGVYSQNNANFFWDNTNNRFLIGTNTIPAGNGKLILKGTDSSASAGPHIQVHTTIDNHPLLQVLGFTHDNIALAFDAYNDGAWKSSDPGSNFWLYKTSDKLKIFANTGVAVGSGVALNEIFSITPAGLMTIAGEIISNSNAIVSLGTNAGLFFQDRTAGNNWGWYGITTARLYNGSADTLTVDTAGRLITMAGITANNGGGQLKMNSASIANNGTAQIGIDAAPAAMLVTINDLHQISLFFLNGVNHTVNELTDTAGVYSAVAGSAGQTNIYWSAANSRYEIENKTGGTRTYRTFYLQA